MVLTHTHMVRGVGVEVAGTEHVAAASFNVRSCDVEIGLLRAGFFLREGSEVNKADHKRKQKQRK
jgi:hypothetical protein